MRLVTVESRVSWKSEEDLIKRFKSELSGLGISFKELTSREELVTYFDSKEPFSWVIKEGPEGMDSRYSASKSNIMTSYWLRLRKTDISVLIYGIVNIGWLDLRVRQLVTHRIRIGRDRFRGASQSTGRVFSGPIEGTSSILEALESSDELLTPEELKKQDQIVV